MIKQTQNFFLIFLLVLYPYICFAQSFIDIPGDHLRYDAVEFLHERGIIHGYVDQAASEDEVFFEPDKKVNRVEALKMVMESSGYKSTLIMNDIEDFFFTDVQKDAWYIPYILHAKHDAIVNGNPDGTFAPGRQVNKVELLKMLLLANKVEVNIDTLKNDLPYHDFEFDSWYFPYMYYAVDYSLIYPDPQGNLFPGELLTRGEVAEIIYRFLLIREGGYIQESLSQAESNMIQSLECIADGNYPEADIKANKALVLTENLIDVNVNEPVIIAAYKIAQSTKKIAEAFVYYKDKKCEEAVTVSKKAKELAAEARSIQYNVAPLSSNIIDRADSIVVLCQARYE